MWREAGAQALRLLWAHKLRAVLTLFGIVWGTAMLTLMRGYNDGYERHFDAQIEKVGPRVVWALPGVVVKDRVGERGSRPVELENDDPVHVDSLLAVDGAAPNLLSSSASGSSVPPA